MNLHFQGYQRVGRLSAQEAENKKAAQRSWEQAQGRATYLRQQNTDACEVAFRRQDGTLETGIFTGQDVSIPQNLSALFIAAQQVEVHAEALKLALPNQPPAEPLNILTTLSRLTKDSPANRTFRDQLLQMAADAIQGRDDKG